MSEEPMDDDELEEWAERHVPARTTKGNVKHSDLTILKMLRADEDKGCEACGWIPSESYRRANEHWYRMLHVHHVIPVVCMGDNMRSNLIVLCPNCHAFAHRMGSITGGQLFAKSWNGPISRDELAAKIRTARSGEMPTQGAT